MASGRKDKTILAVDEKRLQEAEFWAVHARSAAKSPDDTCRSEKPSLPRRREHQCVQGLFTDLF